MTISDKIRIYELSRDLNLENKDILDAAQKLSISVKSHSSSITAEDANKIKSLISKKNSDKKILSINKPSIKEETSKQKNNDKSPFSSSTNGERPIKNNANKKPLLIKPLSKPETPDIILNQPKNDIRRYHFKSTQKCQQTYYCQHKFTKPNKSSTSEFK